MDLKYLITTSWSHITGITHLLRQAFPSPNNLAYSKVLIPSQADVQLLQILLICGGIYNHAEYASYALHKTGLQISEGGDCTFSWLKTHLNTAFFTRHSCGYYHHCPTHSKTALNCNIVTYLTINYVMNMQLWPNLSLLIWLNQVTSQGA